MELKVALNNLRVSPRKSRQVIDLIRNKNVQDARNLLTFAVQKSSEPILKLLNSAAASAVNDLKLQESNLYIARVMVDEGPKLKRSHPMSRGRAYPIVKRTSHITLVLAEKNPTNKEVKLEKTKPVNPVKAIEDTTKKPTTKRKPSVKKVTS
jgi:large subunit ribosomal protein L22